MLPHNWLHDMVAGVGGDRHISEGIVSHCGGGLGQGMVTDTRMLAYRQHGGGGMLQNKSARDPVARHLVRCLYFYSSLYNFHM